MTVRTLPEFTLGWELEACRRASRVPRGIEAGHDGSVSGDGMEYKISRNLVSDIASNLRALRELTTDEQLQVNSSCGFHVHIGLGRRSRQAPAWAAWFVQLARMVENEAFSAVPSSRRENRYCRAWRQDKGSVLERHYVREKYGNSENRYFWVNVVEMFRPGGIRTVEIRLLGSTRRYAYTLAWISACRVMAASAWKLLFDPSRLEAEADECRKAFALVRDSFLSIDDPKRGAKTALYLAGKARLLGPVGTPLRAIAQEEIDVIRQRNQSEAEALEFENLLREMRAATERAGTQRDARIQVDDLVACTRVPEDGTMAIGSIYRVTHVGVAGPGDDWQDGLDITVLNDNARNWHIGRGRVELYERNGVRVMSQARLDEINEMRGQTTCVA